jgi:hypothetical protein
MLDMLAGMTRHVLQKVENMLQWTQLARPSVAAWFSAHVPESYVS